MWYSRFRETGTGFIRTRVPNQTKHKKFIAEARDVANAKISDAQQLTVEAGVWSSGYQLVRTAEKAGYVNKVM